MLNDLLIDKYLELRKLCRNHSLLDLIKLDDSKVILTPEFIKVYESENLISDYFNDLDCALNEEERIQYLFNQRK